jgi:hypothetical protein
LFEQKRARIESSDFSEARPQVLIVQYSKNRVCINFMKD